MARREWMRTPDGRERLFWPAVVVVVVTFAVGLGALRLVQRSLPDEQRAEALATAGKHFAAEQVYVEMLRARPSVPIALTFLENHERGRSKKRPSASGPLDGARSLDPSRAGDENALMDDDAVDALLAALPADISLVARFWRAIDTRTMTASLLAEVSDGAAREPPLPWHNHLLAREAAHRHDLDETATRYEREGLAYPERSEDVDRALSIWIMLDSWDHVRARLADPRVADAASPMTKYRFAVHERDWKSAARWLALTGRPRITAPSLVMASVAALAWFFFCARLGKLGEAPRRRVPLYLLSFVLGVLSIVPTVCLIAVEEAQLRLVETGDAARDVLFFVFGVGLREEASKLLLFLPLLPLLRKWGDRLDVLVCGAMVGLGFATEENFGYLASGHLDTGLGRFLTANFMHMAMTAILASAVFDFASDREREAAKFSRTLLTIVAMHGAYDFLLSHEELGGSYFAMTVFFILVRMFLAAVSEARRRPDPGLSLTQAFVLALAVVTGTSAVYAVGSVGFRQGALVMTEGLLGVAILIYAFVRTLRTI